MKNIHGTIAEKIIGYRVGRRVSPGEFVVVDVDVVYAHDGTAPLAIQVLEENNIRVRSSRVKKFFIIDHASPPPTTAAARAHAMMRRFASENDIVVIDCGEGVCHQVMAESGVVRPGMIVVGADSHTVTLGAFSAFATGVGSTDAALALAYGRVWLRVPESIKIVVNGRLKSGVYSKDLILHVIGELGCDYATYASVEYHGECIRSLSIDARMTITNMTVEMGGKAGLIPVDEATIKWYKKLGVESIPMIKPDENAEYREVIEFNASDVEPVVAEPPNVDRVKSVSEVEGVEVNQVFIGSCTNGRVEDFVTAARILSKHSVKRGVRCIAIPASRRVFLELLRMGVIEILLKAGCIVTHSTCGPCIGAHFGLLGDGEVAVSTSNRNFTGRMGSKDSRVYLASPATAAASAVEGRITDPRKYLRGE